MVDKSTFELWDKYDACCFNCKYRGVCKEYDDDRWLCVSWQFNPSAPKHNLITIWNDRTYKMED